jgi:hypothetical protein
MPLYEIQGPDGKLYEIEGPAGATRDQIIQAVMANMPAPTPEPTFGGNVKEFFKGIPAGFVGTLGTAAEGLASLLPEDTEKSVVGAVRKGVDALSPDAAAGYEDSIGRNLGQAFGSIGSFVIPGGAATVGARALGAGAKGLAATRIGTTGVLGGAAGAGEARQRAEAEGATAEEKSSATAFGVLPGLLEIIPAERILGRFFKPAEAALDAVPDTFKARAVGRIKEIAKTAGIEAAQEAAQGFAQNLIAQGVYKPEQDLIEGLGEQAAYGGAAGAMAEALLGMALGRRASATRRELERRAELERQGLKRDEADKALAAEFNAPLLTGEEATRNLFAGEKEGPAPFSLFETEEEKEVGAAQREDLTRGMQREYGVMKTEMERLQQVAADAADKDDFAAAQQAAAQFKTLKDATAQLEAQAKKQKISLELPKNLGADALQAQISKTKAALKKAATLGETEKVASLAAKIQEIQQQTAATTPDLFGKENIGRIQQQEQAAEKQRKAQEGVTKELEKVAEVKPAMAAFYELMSQQADEARIDAKFQEIESRQGKALERLEFGLDRLGLSALGITGNQRKIAEVDLGKGVIQPKVAEALGLPAAKEDVRAVDILPQVEQAWEQARQKQTSLVNAVAQDQLKIFDTAGLLTPEGKAAVQNEAQLKYLTQLRNVGREAKATLEAQKAEDEFMSAPTKGERRMSQIAEEAQREVGPVGEVAERVTPYTSRNDAFSTLSDAAYMLQKGEFIGGRDTPAPAPSVEEAQADRLDKSINSARAELDKVRKRLLQENDPAVVSNLERRKASVEGRLRTLEAGQTQRTEEAKKAQTLAIRNAVGELLMLEARLDQAQQTGAEETVQQLEKQRNKAEAKLNTLRKRLPKSLFSSILTDAREAADFLIQDALSEIKADRVTRGFGEMPPSEARNLETRLRIEANRFLDRVSTAQRTTGIRKELDKNTPKQRSRKETVETLNKQIAEAKKTQAEAAKTVRELDKEIATANANPRVSEFEKQKLSTQRKEAFEVVTKESKRLEQLNRLLSAPDRAFMPAGETGFERPSIEKRPYQKLGTALQTLRNEIEATITEAKGLPQRGDVELEPVEKIVTPVEKPVKTTKKKIAERQKTLKHENKKQEAINAGRQVIPAIQAKIAAAQKELAKLGKEAADLKKAAVKDRNPQLRLEKAERVEAMMDDLRVQIRDLKAENAALAVAMRTLGVDTGTSKSGAYLLGMIENDQVVNKDELADAGLGAQTVARVQDLQKKKATQQAEVDAQESKLAALKRKLSLGKIFEGALDKPRMDALRKQIDFQARFVEQIKSEVNRTQREIFAALRFSDKNISQLQREIVEKQRYIKEDQAKIKELENRLKFYRDTPANSQVRTSLKEQIASQKQVLENSKKLLVSAETELKATIDNIAKEEEIKEKAKEKGTSRFTDYELITAARFLQARIDSVLQRGKGVDAAASAADVLAKAKIGAITTPTGSKLSGVRVTTKLKESLVRRPQAAIDAEIAAFDQQIKDAEAIRDGIRDANRKEGKPVKTPEWDAANTEVMRLGKKKKAVREFEAGLIPVRDKQDIFATPADVKDALGARQRQTADFIKDKEPDEVEIAKEVERSLRDRVVEAERALADVDPKDRIKMREAKAAIKQAKNELSKAVVYKYRAELTEQDIEQTLTEAKTNVYVAKQKKPVGERGVIDMDEDLAFGTETDADIIGSIDYRDDTIDPRIGEEATDTIDSEAANKRLAEVKKKAKAQGIDFEYYDSIEKLPIGILKQMAKQGMDVYASQVKGGVHKGKVFVVVENHSNLADLEQTLSHELIGHYTFEGLLGPKGMDRLLARVEKDYGKDGENGLDVLAKELGVNEEVTGTFLNTLKYYKQALKDGKITEQEARQAAKRQALKELIAHTTEKVATGIPKSRAEKFKQWIKDMVAALRQWAGDIGLMEVKKFETNELLRLIRNAERAFNAGKPVAYRNLDGTVSFRIGAGPAPTENVAKIIAEPNKRYNDLRGNLMGYNFRTQFLDRWAAFEGLMKKSVAAGQMTELKAQHALYFARKADQRHYMAAQFLTNGPSVISTNAQGELVYAAGKGVSMKNVAEDLAEDAQVPAKIRDQEWTSYLVAIRAKRVGVDKVDFTGTKITAKDVDATIAKYKDNKAFNKARETYMQYNNGLIDFVVQSGAMSSEEGARLKSFGDYVPFYRKMGNDVALFIAGEKSPIRIGDLKNQPYLDQLVGGDQEILPAFLAAAQNTQLLVDMALKNMATRNVAWALADLGLVVKGDKEKGVGIRTGDGGASPNVIRFKDKGVDKYAVVDVRNKQTVFGDIPLELVVQGMEGIKTMIPMGVRMLGMPANLLRAFITRMPDYAFRQVFRDSMFAAMTTGADFVPVLDTFKQMKNIGSSEAYKKMQASGSIGGQVYAGSPDDVRKMLREVQSGKMGPGTLLAKMDKLAQAGDAATRLSLYNSFIRQGLSERQADYAVMESMNFSRRGLSPTMTYMSMMIPFFNAGLQGIDVLYRAFRGDMPQSERLQVKQKLWTRGALMAAMTFAYAAMMDDDETYENANPSERYSNWFVPTPIGTVRVPIPFEPGFIFKALPEGVARLMFSDDKLSEVAKAMLEQLERSVPFDLPTAVKPAIELSLNKSFFTERPIVDQGLEFLAKADQYRPNTPEMIKWFGAIGLSPVQVEYAIRGYTGSMMINIMKLADPLLQTGQPPKPTLKINEYPFIGSIFQRPDASGLINLAYEGAKEAQNAQRAYNRMAEADPENAKKFLEKNITAITFASPAGWFQREMGELSRYERMIRADRDMTSEEKDVKLKEVRDIKISLAKQLREVRAEIERPAAR